MLRRALALALGVALLAASGGCVHAERAPGYECARADECSETCPKMSSRAVHNRTLIEGNECVRRIATAVCEWGEDVHAARRRDYERMSAEAKAERARGAYVIHDRWEFRCDCMYSPLGDCFFKTAGCVIATGAPGCENHWAARDLAARGIRIDAVRCGSVACEPTTHGS